MNIEILHSLAIILTIFVAFIFSQSGIAQYQYQLFAILFIILYLKKRLWPQKDKNTYLLESVIFTLAILTVVNTTGYTSSPYFFLIYFLLFSLGLILEPAISVTATLALAVFFFLIKTPTEGFESLIPVFSIVLISPFALFLGQEIIKNNKLRITNDELGNKLTRNREDTFLFLSLMLKNNIKKIRDAAENFTGDRQLEEIKKTAKRAEKLIEKFEKDL